MSQTVNTVNPPDDFVEVDLDLLDEPIEAPGADPKQKPEVEPEHLPKEDPGQADPDTEEDDDDDDDPFTETEIGDDPDEIEKKTTIF
ncbi:MAG: hypothetical protein JWR18_2115 [Segetibacter sp.]|jgi:hypothetical protein|nr:hypothetical protein [Segetibacter sp.]